MYLIREFTSHRERKVYIFICILTLALNIFEENVVGENIDKNLYIKGRPYRYNSLKNILGRAKHYATNIGQIIHISFYIRFIMQMRTFQSKKVDNRNVSRQSWGKA